MIHKWQKKRENANKKKNLHSIRRKIDSMFCLFFIAVVGAIYESRVMALMYWLLREIFFLSFFV